jgi:predicted lipase
MRNIFIAFLVLLVTVHCAYNTKISL